MGSNRKAEVFSMTGVSAVDNRLQYLMWVLTGILVLFYGVQRIVCFDIWWHLKTGEWILHNHSIPHTDPFSYTFAGHDWLDFEWLFQVIIYPIYSTLGPSGLIVFKTLVIAVLVFFLYKNIHLLSGGKGWIVAFFLVVGLNVMSQRFMVRPQIVFLLLLCLYFYILNLYSIKGKNYLYLLPILQILWVNIHGSFLLGIELILIYISSYFISLVWSQRNDLKPVFKDQKLRALMISTLSVILVSFASPYGYRIFTLPFVMAADQESMKYIVEWFSFAPTSLLIFLPNFTLWFKGLFIIGVFSFFLRIENLKKIEHVLIFTLFSYMAFSSLRFFGAWGVVMCPIIAFNIAQFFSSAVYKKKMIQYIRWVPAVIVIFLSFYVLWSSGEYRRIGFGLAKEHYPSGTVKFIADHGLEGNIFNYYDYGGYLIWHLYPQLKVFIDGRTPTIYDKDFFWAFRQGLYQNENTWKRLIEEYSIDMVLIKDDRMQEYMMFIKRLDDDPDWSLVAFDEVSLLFLKDIPKFRSTIKEYGYKFFRPADFNMNYVKEQKGNKEFLTKLIKELEEAKDKGNGSSLYINYALGSVCLFWDDTEHVEKALHLFQKILEKEPRSSVGLYKLGITLLRLKRYEEAIKALKKVIDINPSFPDSYYQLGIAYYRRGEHRLALKYLEKYKGFKEDEMEVEAYEYLGLAYLKTFQSQKAISCFLREYYLSEPSFAIYQNLAIAYFGLRKYDKASKYFQEALSLRPNDIKLLYDLGISYENLKETERAAAIFKKLTHLPPQTEEERELIEKARLKLEQ
jgi:tetratricopeptide (TPR) repeat protein